MDHRTYIVALGGNLGDSEAIFTGALDLLEGNARVLSRSPWIRTPALVHPEHPKSEQGDYLNALLVLDSALEPLCMMQWLLDTEKKLGRDRSSENIPWGPRCIDLDIVACGTLVLAQPELIVPHPQMHRRDFILELMLEVAPEWVHPILHRTVAEMLVDLRSRESARKSGVACW